MLGRFELLFSILGGWLVSIIIILLFKIKRRGNLPKGSVVVKTDSSKDEIIVPGYNVLLLIGMGINSFLTVFVVILCIFDLWNFVANYIAINLPIWLNWLGIIGVWIQDIWGGVIFSYNVNYTPAYKPMDKEYILATGGPYKLVRHPMYIAKAFLVIFIFFATGIWFAFFGIITWFVLPKQAKREEQALLKKFGKDYEDYYEKTGRFFPNIKFS